MFRRRSAAPITTPPPPPPRGGSAPSKSHLDAEYICHVFTKALDSPHEPLLFFLTVDRHTSPWQILPLSRIDPEIFLFGSTASGAVSAAPTAADPAAHIAAAVVDNPVAVPAEQPVLSSKSPEEIGREGGRIKKNRRKAGKAPVVVEGDDLANTPKMIALVWSSLALNALYLLQVGSQSVFPVPLLAGFC